MPMNEKGFLVDELARAPRLIDRMRAAVRAWRAPGPEPVTVCRFCALPVDQAWAAWCTERSFMPAVNADATPQPPRTDR